MRENNKIFTNASGYNTPFIDEQEYSEAEDVSRASEMLSSHESPFENTYLNENSTGVTHPQAETFVQLLSELNNEEFKDSLIAVAGEMEASLLSPFNNEVSAGSYTQMKQRADEYINRLTNELDNFLSKASEFTSVGRTDAEIETFFNEMELAPSAQLTPVQEQFLGGVLNKVKKIAQSGKKLLDKVSPVHIVLNKVKGLLKPLLNKVINSMIGKLPRELQPYASTLSKKLINLELASEDTASRETFAGEDYEMLSFEFDVRLCNAALAKNETEIDQFLLENEIEHEQEVIAYKTNRSCASKLDSARNKFISRLKEGEDVQVAMEEFLPALYPAVKLAISIVGRPKVVNFLAGLLTKFVGKYVPPTVAKPLSTSIVNLGLGALGFEVAEEAEDTLAYEAIANTVEETVRTLSTDSETDFENYSDNEVIARLSEQLLPAFKNAAANNFPGSVIRRTLQKTKEPGVWVLMPRRSVRKAYKKYAKVFNISLTKETAETLKTFGGASLRDFFKDTLGQMLESPANVRVHLYEAIPGTTLNKIALYDRATGLGTADKSAWSQLHPLTAQAAGVLLNEPALGVDVGDAFITSGEKITVGQRFFFIEWKNGVTVRKPRIRRPIALRRNMEAEVPVAARTTDIQGVLNFVKSSVCINFFISEATANDIVARLNNNDWAGAAGAVRNAMQGNLVKALLKNIKSKVKIVHEAVPELYLKNIPEQEDFLGSLKTFGLRKIVGKLVEKILGSSAGKVKSLFKERAKEFSDALAQPDDGVTIRVSWSNVAGMSAIRGVIKALRDGSLSGFKDLSVPELGTPEVSIIAGKNFM
jgi:hypothetical protein